jgi:hypothetical protein
MRVRDEVLTDSPLFYRVFIILIPRRLERRYCSYQKHTLPVKLRNPLNIYLILRFTFGVKLCLVSLVPSFLRGGFASKWNKELGERVCLSANKHIILYFLQEHSDSNWEIEVWSFLFYQLNHTLFIKTYFTFFFVIMV